MVIVIVSLVVILLAAILVYASSRHKDTQNYYCYPCRRGLVSYSEYLYHTDLHNPNIKRNQYNAMANIDKASVETYAKAPKTISLRFPAGVADFSDGDTVRITIPGRPSVRRTVSYMTDSCKTAELSNGWTALTEDGFGPKLRKNKSYLHIKIGKRFVTYKVVALDENTVSLRKVLANASAGGVSPALRSAVSGALSAIGSAPVTAALRKLEQELRASSR